VVGAGGIAWRRTDSFIFFFDKGIVVQSFGGSVAPKLGPDLLVKVFGQSFSQPVRKGFDHDGIVIIVFFFKCCCQLLCPKPCTDTETAYMILYSRFLRGDKVR